MKFVVDPVFQIRVDASLAALEQSQPTWQRLRRVPMDVIAAAVEGELAKRHRSSCRVVRWKDQALQEALIAVGLRNGAILRAEAPHASLI